MAKRINKNQSSLVEGTLLAKRARKRSLLLDKDKWRIERRYLALGLTVGVLAVIVPVAYDFYKPRLHQVDAPQFDILSMKNPVENVAIVDPADGLVIRPRNDSASRDEPLHIEFDDIPIGTIDAPREHDGLWLSWIFLPMDLDLPEEMTADGRHEIRLRFPEGDFSEKITVWFDSRAPEAFVRIREGENQGRIVEGSTKDNGTSPFDEIYVDLFFNSKDGFVKVPLETERVALENEVVSFKFSADIFGLPEIEDTDPRFKETFFAIQISDQAGNSFFQEMSYARFVAPGEAAFGERQSTYITMEPVTEEFGIRRLDFHVLSADFDGETEETIKLKATAYGLNLSLLEWDNTAILSDEPPTVILRNGERLAVAMGNKFIDRNPEQTSNYRVIQETETRAYGSNAVTVRLPEATYTPVKVDVESSKLLPESSSTRRSPLVSFSVPEAPAITSSSKLDPGLALDSLRSASRDNLSLERSDCVMVMVRTGRDYLARSSSGTGDEYIVEETTKVDLASVDSVEVASRDLIITTNRHITVEESGISVYEPHRRYGDRTRNTNRTTFLLNDDANIDRVRLALEQLINRCKGIRQ